MSAKQHFQPAAYLGGFSRDKTEPARKRRVFVAARGRGAYTKRAEDVAWRRELYTLTEADADVDMIDEQWSATERALRPAIESFAVAQDDWFAADDWATLVEFIAGLFVRGPEFDDRRGAPLIAMGAAHPDNTNVVRALEQQRLLAAVMYGRWHVLRPSGPALLITSDIGYAPTMRVDEAGAPALLGYAFPLRKDLAVAIYADRSGQTMSWHSEEWNVRIPTHVLPDTDVLDLNR